MITNKGAVSTVLHVNTRLIPTDLHVYVLGITVDITDCVYEY